MKEQLAVQWTLPVALGLLLGSLSVDADILIVESGRPAATIVISDNPSPQAQEAAAALQKYLSAISGARLEIRREADAVTGNRILVGRSRSVTDLGIKIPSGVTYQMNEEGFVSKTARGDLVLAGNEDGQYRGTVYAVSDFLEELGCRWFFPGEYGEVVPRRATIRVPERDRIERPDFRFRNIWMAGGAACTKADAEALRDWYDRNKMHALNMRLPGDGSISALAPPKRYYETHPHIFALQKDGTRNRDMMCMSEDDSVRIAVETIKQYFRAHPQAYTFGFAPPDGFPMCYCRKCQAHFPGFTGKGYGDPSLSEIWFGFANRIAGEVYKEFPHRWVLTNGYSNRVRPPEGVGPLSPNLGIQSAIIAACTLHPIGDPNCWQRRLYKQVLDRWTDALDCVFIYDYDPGIAITNLPFPALHNLRTDMPYFKDRGVWGFWTEGGNNWMVTHLNYYVRSKLMWDVEEDVDALVRDYCQKFYGPAAEPVEKYIWTLEGAVEKTHLHETWGRLMRWEIILADAMKDLDRLIVEAEALASTPLETKRIRVLRLTHDHMSAYVAMENAVVDGRFADGVTWGKKMLALRNEIASIKTGLVPHTPDFRKGFRTSLEWHISQYQALADKAGGEKGELVLMLPREWKFKKDPRDVGVLYQWYSQIPDESWSPIDTTLYWEAQGHVDEDGWGYTGKAWYRTDFDLPADADGKPLWLTIGAVYNRGVWVWLNGQMMRFEMNRHHRLGHHDVRSPLQIDLSAVARAGAKNKIAVLVHTDPPGRNPRGGLHRRSFLWRPREVQ